jgi:molybdopterin synthase catalytic subunit
LSIHSAIGVGALKVTVRLFASYRERAGRAEVELDLPLHATVGYLSEEVLRRYPTITRDAAALVVAVNQEYRDHDYPLSDGDEVGLIPPVSGGNM